MPSADSSSVDHAQTEVDPAPTEGDPAPTEADSAYGADDPTPTASAAPPLFGVLVFAGLVIACAGLKQVSGIVGPLFLVLTLVITVHPLRVALVRRGAPAAVASVAALLTMYALLVAVLGSVVWSITKLVEILPTYSSAFTALYQKGLSQLDTLGLSTATLQKAVSSVNLSSFSGVAQNLLSGIQSGLSLLVLMLALVVFLAFDAAGIDDRIALIRAQRPRIAAALVDFSQSVRRYWVVTTVFGFVVAVLDVVSLLIIGVPLALTWGVLAFVTNYIPNVGFVLGLIPPTLVALLDGGAGSALAVLIVYVAVNVIVQTLIQPRFTGDAVGITSTVAFLSLIFWAFVLGALGALLAVPATLLVKALLVDHSVSGSWFGALINSTPEGASKKRPGIGRWFHRFTQRKKPLLEE
jgi:predicted PurR-regulated permease PerM